MLEVSREAALAIRRLEEQVEIRREAIGVQGHNSFEVHSKCGTRDPMRHVIEFMDWRNELLSMPDYSAPIAEAAELVSGMEHISDGATVEVVARYYLQGETWREILDGYEHNGTVMPPISERMDGLSEIPKDKQLESVKGRVDALIERCERIGMAYLKEAGR